MLTLEDAKETLDGAVNGCDYHSVPFGGADLAEVLRAKRSCRCELTDDRTCDSYCDSESIFVARLHDNRVAVFWEWSDTTGHG